ncbi:MAG: helix-turn-helix domain-containing protein [Gammaproteobacteria bacterium]|nr:helix-turn-helix domain-containing protein [Pseudomonadales bacterium]MCP5345614.1 helix-turn-helix domain-containing protein [Pseudomonadales bacterium]
MRICLIALDRALASSITIPLEMLFAARSISLVEGGRNSDLQLQVVGPGIEQVTMAGGLKLVPTARLEELPGADLIFVPGLWGSPLKTVRKSPRLLRALATCHAAGSTLVSLVTGSYFLAEAGLLDGRSATTHWYYFDDFESRYPAVRLDRRRFITLEERLYCTGSVNAARDVTLHLVEEIFGESIATEIAKHFTHEIKRSYESMLLSYQRQDTHHDEVIIKVQEWLQGHYAEEVRLPSVAAHFKLSVRSLNRRFKSATGQTPLQYVQEIRVNQAKQLLKQSNLTIAEVSFKTGYQDSSHFSSLFRKVTGIAPAEYRALVRSKLFRVEE